MPDTSRRVSCHTASPSGVSWDSCQQPGNQPGHHDNGSTVALAAAESKDMLGLCSEGLSREIVPNRKQPGISAAAVER